MSVIKSTIIQTKKTDITQQSLTLIYLHLCVLKQYKIIFLIRNDTIKPHKRHKSIFMYSKHFSLYIGSNKVVFTTFVLSCFHFY